MGLTKKPIKKRYPEGARWPLLDPRLLPRPGIDPSIGTSRLRDLPSEPLRRDSIGIF